MKNLKIIWLFTQYSIKTTFQNKVGVVLFTFGKLLRFGMFFTFIFYLLSATDLLAGYTLNETLIFFLTYNIVDGIAQLFFREVYRFRQLVVSGELNTILVKPYHPFLRILFGGVDVLDAFVNAVYIALAVYFIAQLPTVTAEGIALYLLLIFNALIITLGIHIAVLALGILTTEVDHTIMIFRDITRMGAFPVDIYQQPIRFMLTYVIPIGVMMTFPVKGLLNLLSLDVVFISFAFGVGSVLISYLMWMYALRKYQSWGG